MRIINTSKTTCFSIANFSHSLELNQKKHTHIAYIGNKIIPFFCAYSKLKSFISFKAISLSWWFTMQDTFDCVCYNAGNAIWIFTRAQARKAFFSKWVFIMCIVWYISALLQMLKLPFHIYSTFSQYNTVKLYGYVFWNCSCSITFDFTFVCNSSKTPSHIKDE